MIMHLFLFSLAFPSYLIDLAECPCCQMYCIQLGCPKKLP